MKKELALNALLVLMIMSSLTTSVFAQGLADIIACRDGDTRPCGSDVGACEKGHSICIRGMWGDCEGGVGPVDEICSDGIDNDCNGLVDDCGFNTVSIILIGCGLMLLVVALVLNKMGK